MSSVSRSFDFRMAAFSAGRWTAASSSLRIGIQLLQTACLARLLVPADFGLMAMASTVIAMAQLISDMGLSSSLIHFPLPSKKVLSALYWINLILAVALGFVFLLLAASVSDIFGHPQLIPVLSAIAVVFPINAFGQQAKTLAEKRLEFSRLAAIEIVSAAFGFFIAVLAAWFGIGVLSFAFGIIFSSATNSILVRKMLRTELVPVGTPDLGAIKPYLLYGAHRIGEQFWGALRLQSDLFIASLMAAPSVVAYYALPRDQSVRVANALVNPVATRVGLPIMASLQGDKNSLRMAYLRMVHFTACVNFPLYAALFCFPEEIIAIFLGRQWVDAATFLRIFAAWGLIRSSGNLSGSLLYAAGRVRRAHIWNLLNLLFAVPILWLSAKRWSLTGLAWSMLSIQLLTFIAAWRFLILPACGAGFREYLRQLAPPLTATLAAGVAASTATLGMSGALRLLVGICVFLGAYVGCSSLVNPRGVRLFRELLAPVFSDRFSLRKAQP